MPSIRRRIRSRPRTCWRRFITPWAFPPEPRSSTAKTAPTASATARRSRRFSDGSAHDQPYDHLSLSMLPGSTALQAVLEGRRDVEMEMSNVRHATSLGAVAVYDHGSDPDICLFADNGIHLLPTAHWRPADFSIGALVFCPIHVRAALFPNRNR